MCSNCATSVIRRPIVFIECNKWTISMCQKSLLHPPCSPAFVHCVLDVIQEAGRLEKDFAERLTLSARAFPKSISNLSHLSYWIKRSLSSCSHSSNRIFVVLVLVISIRLVVFIVCRKFTLAKTAIHRSSRLPNYVCHYRKFYKSARMRATRCRDVHDVAVANFNIYL